jgi:hypothetical protein
MKISYILILLFNFKVAASINFNDPKFKNLKVDHNKKTKKKVKASLDDIVIEAKDYLLGFSLLHSNIKYYATYLKLQFKLKENIVFYKSHESGSIIGLQFYNNSHLFNVNPNNKLKTMANKDEIIGDPFLIIYHLNEQNNILSYGLILNNSASRKHLTYIQKDIIASQFSVNDDLEILIPIPGLTIADLSLKKLYPYVINYQNRGLIIKNLETFQKKDQKKIRENLEATSKENDQEFYEKTSITPREKPLLMDETGQLILDENGYAQYDNPLDAIEIPNEYWVFQYFIKFPKADEAKILFVYADANYNIIKMELKKTFLSKNYSNKNLIKDWFMRALKPGKTVNGNFFLLNNIIFRTPFIQLNIGVILDHHKFNECHSKKNFFMVMASFDPEENILLNVKRIEECCSKKSLNLI